jgi:hypothetical protein
MVSITAASRLTHSVRSPAAHDLSTDLAGPVVWCRGMSSYRVAKLIEARNTPRIPAIAHVDAEPPSAPWRHLVSVRLLDLHHLSETLPILGLPGFTWRRTASRTAPRRDPQVLRPLLAEIGLPRMSSGRDRVGSSLARPALSQHLKAIQPRVGCFDLVVLWWPGAGSNRRPSDFQAYT